MKKIFTTNVKEPIEDLVEFISLERFKDKSLLLLISGGSTVELVAEVLSRLEKVDLKISLHIGLIDERYGLEGHINSNWQKLLNSGVSINTVHNHPVLYEKDSISETTHRYNRLVEDLLDSVDYSIGIFGIGIDGHTAGILPYSSVINEDEFYAHYNAVDYKRISITPTGINRLDQIIIYATGKEKWPAIDAMQNEGSVNKIPARMFKEMKNVILYTDYEGEIQ